MPVEDVEMTRTVRREISRRYIDSTNMDIRCIHGVVYLSGRIEKLRSHPDVDLDEELDVIQRIIHQRPGVREVVVEINRAKRGINEKSSNTR